LSYLLETIMQFLYMKITSIDTCTWYNTQHRHKLRQPDGAK
jgi:hypothetical protein